MLKEIKKSTISGTVKAPASKSMMIRAVAMAILADKHTKIINVHYCDDFISALNIAEKLNCNIVKNDNFVQIHKTVNFNIPKEINCRESALCMRLFASILALENKPFILKSTGSLQKRPMQFMSVTFEQLGVNFNTNNGFSPLNISGTFNNTFAQVDGSESSQFLSGLLMSLPKAKQNTTLKVNNLVSKPYIDITLQIIEQFGGKISYKSDYTEFCILGNQHYNCEKIQIEGDWSGASSMLVAGAIGGNITVNNLDIASAQADKKILEAIKKTGANVTINNKSVNVQTCNELNYFEFDAENCPDLFPVLTALAANCKGISKIKGISRLINKESNRALVLQKEFAKLGININFEGDFMLIEGGKIKGANTNSHNDHRIAMALCLAGINSSGTVIINGAECVNKTYPQFFDDIKLVISNS